jgi:hypothetical protein
MLPNRLKTSLLRPILALLAFAGLLALGGCGGGSGAPNNPFAQQPTPPGPLFVLPPTLTAYSHTPATLTVSGGAPPYQAFTGNQQLLPVTQIVNGSTIVLLPNDVAAATPVVITVQDSIGQTATATVTVSPAPIFNTLTITPARAACGANTVCSGDIATATVTVAGTGGAGIPNRQVKFDVITGAFFILSNSNPGQPLVSTLTVVSDNNGVATVVLQAAVNAPTQPAILRATEVSTGNSVNGVFTIVQQTSGAAILSVVPPTATITGAFANQCSFNFRIDYYIYGGTPPYTVASTFPAGVTLVNSTVPASGGFFTAITNGSCVNPLVFTIVDSVGRQTTASLINQPGTATPPTPPAPTALTLTPATITVGPGVGTCTGKTFGFVISGGTPGYSVTSPGATIAPTPPINSSPGSVSISGFLDGSGAHAVGVGDSGNPQQVKSATITCN